MRDLFPAGPRAAFLLCLLPAFVQAAELRVLPPHRAHFLPGACFDLVVEVAATEEPDSVRVLVNGIQLQEFFSPCPPPEVRRSADGRRSLLTWRGLALPHAGMFLVEASAAESRQRVTWFAVPPDPPGGARNVILFIADGMTVPMLTAARLVSRGNVEGRYNSVLAVDTMEEVGLVHTSGLDSIITDSANSASAYNTGHKTATGAMGLYVDASAKDEGRSTDPRVETLAELLRAHTSMGVGVVTTADLTDATPAAVFAHVPERSWSDQIAAAPLDSGLLPEVLLGGGAAHFLSRAEGGLRGDDRDLAAEYREAGSTLARTAADLEFASAPPERLLGLFAPGNMDSVLERRAAASGQPGLEEMTRAALDVLGRCEEGFYLMVEGAMVDKFMHAMDFERSLADLIEFDRAVAVAQDWIAAHAPDTLLVVTSDHAHGYDVYGTVDQARFQAAEDDAARVAAIDTYADAGFPDYPDADLDYYPDRWDGNRTLAGLTTNHPGYVEDFLPSAEPFGAMAAESGLALEGNVPGRSGVHTLQDVPLFASGPGAEYFGRVLDNTEVFLGMARALGLDPLAPGGRVPPGRLEAASGLAFGDVTASSAVVWSRASQAATMLVEWSPDADFARSETAAAAAQRSTDFTARALLTGLEPGTRYHVRVQFLAGAERTAPATGSFPTAPAPGVARAVGFALIGDLSGQQLCRRPDQGFAILEHVRTREPDFVVANGDMVYVDYDCPAVTASGWRNVPGDFPAVAAPGVDWTDRRVLEDVVSRHWRYNWADPHFQALRRTVPLYSQWDDHEVLNDFGAGSGWAEWSLPVHGRPGFENLVDVGRAAFFHWSPIQACAEEPGRIYRSFRWGQDLELFLVDARSYRDVNALPESGGKTLLGAAQLAWLRDGVTGSGATWKVVSLDVPLSIPTGSSSRGRDGFASGSAERAAGDTGFEDELLSLLADLDAAGVRNLVFVAMDVHFAMSLAYALDLDGDGDELVFHEFLSGPTNAGPGTPRDPDPTLRPRELFRKGDCFNFGWYRVDRDAQGSTFTAEVCGEDGAVFEGSRVELRAR